MIPLIRGLSLTAINSTTVRAKWIAIPNDYVDGGLIGYNITLERKLFDYHLQSSFKIRTRSVLLKGLHPGTLYRVHVNGYTANNTRESKFVTIATREL